MIIFRREPFRRAADFICRDFIGGNFIGEDLITATGIILKKQFRVYK